MMVDLKVMAYFKISLSTRNWDRANKKASSRGLLPLSGSGSGGLITLVTSALGTWRQGFSRHQLQLQQRIAVLNEVIDVIG